MNNRDNFHLELQLRKIASQSNYSPNRKNKKIINKSSDKENMTNKIKNEKDPNKIVDMILFDKGLNEENRELTNLLIDQKNFVSSSSFIQKVRENFFNDEYNRDNFHLELQLRKIASQSNYSPNRKNKKIK